MRSKPIRVFSCLLTLLTLCSVFTNAFALEEAETEQKKRIKNNQAYVYEILEDGNAVILEYTGREWHCCIPEYLDGHMVIGIEANAFFNKRFLRTISMPNTIEWIGEQAFACCDMLTNVGFSSELVSVGAGAFADCWSLGSAHLPDTLTEIPAAMFTGCWLLREVTCSDKLTKIDRDAFWGCRNLKSFDFPNTLIEIGTGAFRECESLQEIKIPEKIERIAYHSFMQCTRLKKIELPKQLQEIDDSAFVQCWNLREVQIPDSVTRIGTMAFNGCSSRLILIGKNGSAAWQYCTQDAEEIVIGDDFSFKDADTGVVTPMRYPVLHDLFYGASLWIGKVINIPISLFANLTHLFIR